MFIYHCQNALHLISFFVFRNKASLLPAQPQNRAGLIVAPPWSLTTDGRQLLLVDDGAADKILVFCTPENFARYT